jgi:hypothetical protein
MSWFDDLFGRNPADKASAYTGQIPGAVAPYLNPFFDAGKGALPSLQEQYKQLLADPGGFMNKLAGSYKESPGLQNNIRQAMQAGGHAAAAGGMAGSPMHEQQNMDAATDISSKDYNQYMQNMLGLYGQGLSGQQGMAGMGMQAGQSMADMISQALNQQGAYAYQGQAGRNQNRSSIFNNLLGAFGGLGGLF